MSENAPNTDTETKMFQVPESSTYNILQNDGTNEVQVITGSDLRPDSQAELTASHEISKDNKDGITVKLSNAWMINHLQFMVGEKGSSCSYMIWIEADQSDINPEDKGDESGSNEKWTRVCDFSGVDCHGLQNVYFPMKVVRLIKILGLKTSASTTFKVSSVKAFKTDLEVGDNWELNSNWGLIAPKTTPLLINLQSGVDVDTDSPENYALKKHENGNFDVHLCQPALITHLSLGLPTGAAWETDGYITVTSGSGNEEIIIDKKFDEATVDNQLELKFANPKEILFIKIVGLGSEREHEQAQKEEAKNESQEKGQDNDVGKTKPTDEQKQTKPTEAQPLARENEKVPVWGTLNSEAKQRAGLVLASVFVGMVAAAVILLNLSILSGVIWGNDVAVSNDAQPPMEYKD